MHALFQSSASFCSLEAVLVGKVALTKLRKHQEARGVAVKLETTLFLDFDLMTIGPSVNTEEEKEYLLSALTAVH